MPAQAARRPGPPLAGGGRPVHRRRRPGRDVPLWLARLMVLAATGTSLAAGLYHLTARSLWLDEGYTWVIANFKISDLWNASGDAGGHLFLYYLLLHPLVQWFGDSAFVLRLPSVVAGAAAVPLVYLVASRLAASRRAGIYAAVLLAVSAPLVFWQQNAREYSFIVLLAVSSTLLLVIAVQNQSHAALVGWAVLVTTACYTNAQAGFLIPAQLLPVLLWPLAKAMRRSLLVVVAVAVVASAYPLASASAHASATVHLPPPNWVAAREVATFLASGAGTPAAVSGADYALLGVMAFLWAVALLALAFDLFDRGRTDNNLGPALALSWLIVPPLLSWAVSEAYHPIFADTRYLIISLPAAAAVVAMLLARLKPRTLGLYGLVYLLVFRFGALAPTYSTQLDDYAGATKTVLTHAVRGDCILFYPTSRRMLYDYYAVRIQRQASHRVLLPVQALPLAPTTDNPSVVNYFSNLSPSFLATQQSGAVINVLPYYCPRVWLFESRAGQPTGDSAVRQLYTGLATLRLHLGTSFHLAAYYAFARVELQLYKRRSVPGPAGGP